MDSAYYGKIRITFVRFDEAFIGEQARHYSTKCSERLVTSFLTTLRYFISLLSLRSHRAA